MTNSIIFESMKFAYPEFLYAFAVLLIPIIIHLFNFKRYKVLYFSSLQFISQINKQTKSTQKLKHIIALLLRLLAFSALIFAFAQPYIPSKSVSTVKQQPVMAIYLDNSFSMAARGTNGNLLNQGREAIRKLVKQAPLGTNFMLLTNNLSGIEQRLINKNELLDRLDNIDFSPMSRDVAVPLNTIKEMLDNQFYEGQRQYVIIGDFQKNSYTFNNIKPDSNARYYPIQLIPQSYSNLYIDSVWFETPLRKINTNNTLNVRIKNTGLEDLKNVELALNVNEYQRQLLVDVPANGSVVSQVNYSDKTTGLKSGKVEVNDNQLFFDDSYYFSYEVKSSANVLVIQGNEALPYPKLVYQTDEFYSVQERKENQVLLNEVKESDIIILNDINEFTTGLTTRLIEFVKNGGSLMIIPSENADIVSYNSLLSKIDLPLMKAKQDLSLRLNQINQDASFFSGVFDDNQRKINLPIVKKYFKSQLTTQSNANILVAFENGDPFFVENGGDLKAYMLYAGISETFGKVSEHALFSTLLLRIGEISEDNLNLALNLGSPNSYRVFRPSNIEGAIHLQNEEIDIIPPTQRKGAYDYISLEQMEISQKINAGVYNIKIKDEIIDQLAVNYDRKESINEALDKVSIISLMEEKNINNITMNSVSDITDIEQLSLEKPTEYWRILLILAISFLILEMLLIKLWKI